MLEILEKLGGKYKELTNLLSDREVLSNKNRYKQVAKEHKDLSEIMELGSKYKKLIKQIEEDEQIKNDSRDKELVELAKSELEELYPRKKEYENRLRLLLLPKDPHDIRNTILEIRAGSGGEEAGLFVADLYKIYLKYAERKGWKAEVLSSNPTGVGGFKEMIFLVEGDQAFGTLKY